MNQSSTEKKDQKLVTEINTPKRESLLLSPSALIQVGASPDSKRYSSIRKIDFEHKERTVLTEIWSF